MPAPPLFRNMVLFGRLLRTQGIQVTPRQMRDWIRALAFVSLHSRTDFKNVARALLVSRHEDTPRFERLFELFWSGRWETSQPPLPLGQLLQKAVLRHPQGVLDREEPDQTSSSPPGSDPQEGRALYSAQERLKKKDFAQLTRQEEEEIRILLRKLAWNLEKRKTRRRVPARRGPLLDLRRTLRQNLRHGGEPLRLRWRASKRKRRPLVVLCDVSGSMEPYSRLLLQFLYVITAGLEKVETFAFGTRLTRITRELHPPRIDQALARVAEAVRDWGGGTRIGQALKEFNYRWARRVLTQGAIVLLISDGWDRGDVLRLRQEMARLQRSCHRLIWLNPLLGSDRYQPLTRGMRAALPYIDDFLPVHNLDSLQRLGDLLQALGTVSHQRLRQERVLKQSLTGSSFLGGPRA